VNTDHSDGTNMERWQNGNVTHSVNWLLALKQPGYGSDYPLPSSAKVRARIQLYISLLCLCVLKLILSWYWQEPTPAHSTCNTKQCQPRIANNYFNGFMDKIKWQQIIVHNNKIIQDKYLDPRNHNNNNLT
jgi:hypothetical protein